MPRAAWLRVLVLSLALTGALVGCDEQGAANSSEADARAEPMVLSAADVTRVRRGQIAVGPRISGRIELAQKANVRAEIGGQILQVGPDRGQRVKAGDLLAEIDTQSAGANVESARVAVRSAKESLDVARSELKRTQYLIDEGAFAPNRIDVPKNQVAAAQAQLEQARAQYTSAKETQGDATVRAPMDGVVSQRGVDPGDVVSPGELLFTVVDPDSARFEANAPADAAGALTAGAPVQFQVRGYPGRTFRGQIEQVIPVAEADTRQIPLIVAIAPAEPGPEADAAPPNPEAPSAPPAQPPLYAGLFAEGRVLSQSARGLLLDRDAIDKNDRQASVLAVRDGVVRRVPVELGLVDEETSTVQVRSGLQAGEYVLVGITGRQMQPGTPVKVAIDQPPPSPNSQDEQPSTSPNIGGGPPDDTAQKGAQ